MTVTQALEQLIEIEEKRQEEAYTKDMCVGMARLGPKDQMIIAGAMALARPLPMQRTMTSRFS